jgi:hypothetical protein
VLRFHDTPSPADQWPAWTDEDTWEQGPDPEDARWWAEQNESWDTDDDRPDSHWDERADESAAQDRMERGTLL